MTNEPVVTRVTDTEFLIGPNEVKLINGNLVYIKAVGPQTHEIALVHLDLYRKFYEEISSPLNFLIDLNEAGKNSPEARKAWKDASENAFTAKVALVGIHPVARVLAGFVMSVTSSSKIQFFSTIEQAIRWLSE